MVAVLSAQMLGQFQAQRHLAAIFADGALQDTHGVMLFVSRLVVPTFDRGGGVLHVPAVDRMRPDFFGQRLNGCLEFSARRGSAQQRTNHREPKAGPPSGGGWSRFFGHHISSKKIEFRNYVRPYRA
jgi:hypothetical protein